MDLIEVYSQSQIDDITRKRFGESKIGEEVIVISDATRWEDDLENNDSKFVIIGIPEDIGVRANLGRGGAHTAWKPALDSFLNQQSNQFLNGKECCVLGHIFVDDLMEKANQLNSKTKQAFLDLRQLVSELDNRVCLVISKIISASKIPIIIGGGHNNAFPIIKACSEILNKKINVINCDPHTDFRPQEGRHSGNGFSYAFFENYLNKYSVCCIHEQYNTTDVLKTFQKNNSQLYYSTYEDVFVREQITYTQALNQTIGFVKNDLCGIEIDLDAITNVPSSAKTSSGLSPIQARQYVYQSAKQLNTLYFHIAEGAPILSHIKADNKTGKLIAYLISDFIKGITEND
jgi:formiminoglutamase